MMEERLSGSLWRLIWSRNVHSLQIVKFNLQSYDTCSGTELIVLEVHPLSKDCRFKIIRSLKTHGADLGIAATTHGIVAFHHEAFVTVWNFLKDLIVTWNVLDHYIDVSQGSRFCPSMR